MTLVSLHLRYLGAAGWHVRTADSSLLIDPYFTRLSMRQVLIGPAIPDQAAIARHTPPAQWILVTHGHYDHLMDVPEAVRLTGARVFASPQSADLLRILGVADSSLNAIHPGDVLTCGDIQVEVYPSRHRRILGSIPYQGSLRDGLAPPLHARDYRMDVQYSLRLTAGGIRILVTSGIDQEPQVEADVLLVGADASRRQLATILEGARPRLVLPNHWDDMFRPLFQPTRPMLAPLPGLIPWLRRIDLDAFARTICALAPDAAVIIPRVFGEVDLGLLMNSHGGSIAGHAT